MKIYQVGGSVRDEFIEQFHGVKRGGSDIDFAVEVESFDAMREGLLERGFVVHTESPQYLTIKCRVPEGHEVREYAKDADFTLCRSEGDYVDGRHPETVEVGTIQTDLARRDFRMNAIARDTETGEIFDPHVGMHDIRVGMVSCVGDARERILEEDVLRGLRALRFGLTLGFVIDLDIRNVMLDPAYARRVADLPIERVYAEMRKMFRWDTAKSLEFFMSFTTPELRSVLFGDRLWIEPTLAER